MKTDNIILLGMPGCGKSTIGLNVSKKLNKDFFDLDVEIEKNQQMKITDIFKTKGEDYFREIEKKELKKFLLKNSFVLSLGGGTILFDENIDIIKKIGISIYLEIMPDKIFERIKNDDKRPLLLGDERLEKLKKLYESRKEKYEKSCDYKINALLDKKELTCEVIKIYEENNL